MCRCRRERYRAAVTDTEWQMLVSSDDSGDTIDQAAAFALSRDLVRMAGIDTVPHDGVPPDGAKSGMGLAIGPLVVSATLSTAAVKALAQIVVANLKRNSARVITLAGKGNKLVITGASAESERQIVEWILHQKSEEPGQ